MMSIRQPIQSFLITPNVPRLRVTSQLLTPGNWTMMCWAKMEGPFSTTYRDIFGVSDTNNVVGISVFSRDGTAGSHFANGVAAIPGSTDYYFNIGDLNSDQPGQFIIPFDEWHHFCITLEDTAGTGTRGIGYFDGQVVIDGTFINAFPPTFVSFANTRASDSDAGAVWQGELAALKVWDARALTPAEIRREMPYYMAIDRNNLWALTPLTDWNQVKTASGLTENLAYTQQWTWVGTDWAADKTSPPGVSWDNMAAHNITQNFNLGTWTDFSNPTRSASVPPQQRY